VGDRLSELADYRKIHGHCNVPKATAKTKLAKWVATQGDYRLHERKIVYDYQRIQELEAGF
jgi:hypothetical protein